MKKIILTLIAAVVISGCDYIPEIGSQEENLDNYLVYTKKVVETFKDTMSTGKLTAEYKYDMKGDYFWKEATFTDETDDIIKTITREFDVNRRPVKEITNELDIIQTALVSYSPDNFELLTSKIYMGEPAPENLSMETENIYDNNGYLIKAITKKYSTDSAYVNADGNKMTDHVIIRYLPSTSTRPKGNYHVYSWVEKHVSYYTGPETEDMKPGAVEFVEKSEFDGMGYPIHMTVTEAECSAHATEEWYAIEHDEDDSLRVLSITGYMNEKKDSLTNRNRKISFIYDDDMISAITEHRYNPVTSEFDMLHDSATYNWHYPEIKSHANYIDANVEKEHYCFGGNVHSKYQYKIMRCDDVGIKVVEECSDGYRGDYNTQELKPALFRRTTWYYMQYNRDGESIVIKKHTGEPVYEMPKTEEISASDSGSKVENQDEAKEAETKSNDNETKAEVTH